MDTIQLLTLSVVSITFALYIGIAIWSRAKSTSDFYVAGKHVHPLANGMATAADWMSAASFISMAGLIAFRGRDGSAFLMGWTGGYVLLALLLAPYLQKFRKFTMPDFVGERYYSQTARLVALICAIFVSFTYVAGQMRGVGVVFSRFLNVPIRKTGWCTYRFRIQSLYRGVHDYTESVLPNRCAYGWNSRASPCGYSFFHGSTCKRCAAISWMGASVYRNFIHHSACCCRFCAL